MNDIELIDEIVKRAEEHQKQREIEFAIAELEKIKAEINKCRDDIITRHDNTEVDLSRLDGINLAVIILDNHIKELKGEQE